MASDSRRIPLPDFLKLLSSSNLPVKSAMLVAGKIYKDYNTPAQLRSLTDIKLTAAGITEKDVRRLVLTALQKGGYTPLKRKRPDVEEGPSSVAGPSTARAIPQRIAKRSRRKREANEFLPDRSDEDDIDSDTNLDFHEILDERAISTKSTIINRSPVMMAWATIVAERLGFKRDEALSIGFKSKLCLNIYGPNNVSASVYTEMNAISKGVSLGIYEQGKQYGLDADKQGSQPYVDIMNRSPLFRAQSGQWRAMLNSEPASPSHAFSYISQSFRQTTGHVMGALRLLAESYSSEALNKVAWELYAQFRPAAEGWGKRAQMSCAIILSLRDTTGRGSSSQSVSDTMTPISCHNDDTPPHLEDHIEFVASDTGNIQGCN
ncbi:hypothetical protein AMATHDRAFT_1834 [Amanita thiersii Skay4041]|uniref:Uncharacterized protein n=1 Tax=Amanita thiersii Skay4041 TaxID=703135 RepID=A0A2A9NWP2_9AGAR|nr:hypothetical protein AMATHDRAFT_1834 [Amanita thiersii Skay4041]